VGPSLANAIAAAGVVFLVLLAQRQDNSALAAAAFAGADPS
jgi:hypothetical protein